ncbi:MAG: hypothetical protein QM726_14465 [Chitinophagaceae bacterium]
MKYKPVIIYLLFFLNSCKSKNIDAIAYPKEIFSNEDIHQLKKQFPKESYSPDNPKWDGYEYLVVKDTLFAKEIFARLFFTFHHGEMQEVLINYFTITASGKDSLKYFYENALGKAQTSVSVFDIYLRNSEKSTDTCKIKKQPIDSRVGYYRWFKK